MNDANVIQVCGDITMTPEQGCFSLQDLISALGNAEGDGVTIVINSYGGDAYAGLGMHNAIRQYGKRTTAVIGSIAASAASLIAMAADEIIIPETAMLWIHQTWTCALGTADMMEGEAEVLRKLDDAITDIYCYRAREGAARNAIIARMKKDTPLTAGETAELFKNVTVLPITTTVQNTVIRQPELKAPPPESIPEAGSPTKGLKEFLNALTTGGIKQQ